MPDLLAWLSSFLAARGLSWALVGGHAANIHRDELRLTTDYDVLVSLGGVSIADLAADMVRDGWEVRQRTGEGWLLRAEHAAYGKLDLIATGMEYQEIALSRAIDMELPSGVTVKVMAVEDVLIHKLIAHRDKDDWDVRSILRAKPKLDCEYLRQWMAFWDVDVRYERLRRQACDEAEGLGWSDLDESPLDGGV